MRYKVFIATKPPIMIYGNIKNITLLVRTPIPPDGHRDFPREEGALETFPPWGK
jgi:hypothetical protein